MMTDFTFPKPICLIITFFILTALTASCQNKASDKSAWPSSLLLMPEGLKKEQMPDPNSEGAKLTVQYCSQCHGIPYPAGHSASDWVVIMRKMMLLTQQSEDLGSRGGMMGGMRRGMMRRRNMPMGMMSAKVPTQTEQKEILSYLQANSLKTIEENELPDLSGSQTEEFKNSCSRCHALPSPYQHTAEQWPAVVERMRKRMKDYNMAAITDEEGNSIIKYLQTVAAKQ